MISTSDVSPHGGPVGRLTDAEREFAFKHHVEIRVNAFNVDGGLCRACSFDWPCPTKRLVVENADLAGEVTRLREKLNRLRKTARDLDALERANCDRSPCSCGMHRDRT